MIFLLPTANSGMGICKQAKEEKDAFWCQGCQGIKMKNNVYKGGRNYPIVLFELPHVQPHSKDCHV